MRIRTLGKINAPTLSGSSEPGQDPVLNYLVSNKVSDPDPRFWIPWIRIRIFKFLVSGSGHFDLDPNFLFYLMHVKKTLILGEKQALDPDPHIFPTQDPDPQIFGTLDPDPHEMVADPKPWFQGSRPAS